MLKSTKLALALRERRNKLEIKQQELADKLGIAQTTYSKKEIEGDFTESELKVLAKELKLSYVTLVELAKEGSLQVGDVNQFLIKTAVQNQSILRVLLTAIAEIQSNTNGGGNIKEALSRLQKAVDRESATMLKELQPA